jgi:hypothetical protein
MTRRATRTVIRWLTAPVGAVLTALVCVTGTVSAESPAEQQLIRAYRAAHEAKDVERAMALVYWAGVADDIRASFRRNFQSDFVRKISAVQVVPREANQLTEYTREGRTYRTNLPVVGNLVVRFEPPQADGVTATTYPLGARDGKLFITTAVAVP